MTPMTPTVIQGGIRTMEQLMETAQVVEITSYRPGEYRKVDSSSVDMATYDNDFEKTDLTQEDKKKLHLGKKIMESPEVSALSALDRLFKEQMKRKALSSPFKAGHYLVANTKFDEVDKMISDYRVEREVLKKALLDRLDDIILSDKERLPKNLFNPNDYPTREELDRRIHVDVHYTSYGTPKGLYSLSKEAYDRERKRAERECSALMDTLRDGLRSSMGKFISTLQNQLSAKQDGTKRKVYKNTLTNLKEFLELFEHKNFAGDSELQTIVDNARKLLSGVDAGDIRTNEGLRDSLNKGMENLATQVASLSETVSTRRYAV